MTRFDIRKASCTLGIAAAALVCAGAIAQGGRAEQQPATVAYSVAPDAPRTPSAPKAPDVLPGVTPAGDAPVADEPIPQG